MIIGFTGTQKGMTPSQRRKINELLSETLATECHHGDCIGADDMFHDLCLRAGHDIIIHPPLNTAKQANSCIAGRYRTTSTSKIIILPAKEYISRNHDIVRACQILLATPQSAHEDVRSGTWATIRFARKMGKEVIVVAPDGTLLD